MLRRHLLARVRGPNTRSCQAHCHHSTQTKRSQISQVKQLPNWELETFQRDAFNAQVPAHLPFIASNLPVACSKWFTHDTHLENTRPQHSELKPSFWSEYESTLVPLELTSTTSPDGAVEFHRTSAPLKLLLSYLGDGAPAQGSTQHSIYLAQCPLPSLPASLQADLPTPALVLKAGRGDIYDSSLWLGRPPTYTPLHRDPNPNLFVQLAGQKHVRLFAPEVGDAVFREVQRGLREQGAGQAMSAVLRGEEMMQGAERERLHRAVWEEDEMGEWAEFVLEVKLGLGEALFIPKGWWHSVKGFGSGLTASANWWFR